MRICSRCNKEVQKGETICSRCGASLVRDKYNKRVGNDEVRESMSNYKTDSNTDNSTNTGFSSFNYQTNYKKTGFNNTEEMKKSFSKIFNEKLINDTFNKVNSTEKNISSSATDTVIRVRKVIVAIVIINMLIAIIPILIGIFAGTKQFDKVTNSFVNKEQIDADTIYDKYIKYSDVYAEDYLNVWKLSNENSNITVDDIVNTTTITKENTDVTECQLLQYNHKTNTALNCVVAAHKKQGTYDLALKQLTDFYELIYNKKTVESKNTLIKIYNDAYDLFYLPYSTHNYENYMYEYETTVQEIEFYIEKI